MSFDVLPWLHGYGGLLLTGLWRTIFIAVLGYALGLLLGLGLALLRSGSNRIVARVVKLYSGLLRALPELIVIMLLYYICGDAISWLLSHLGLGQIEIDGTWAAIIVLGLATSAYATEIFGAAIRAVPSGALEAAANLGMSRALCFRRITFPLMLPMALPGLANLWLMVVKGTSLVSVVGVMELALAAEQGAGATKEYFAFYLTAAALYLTLALITLKVFKQFELQMRRGQVRL